MKVFLDIDGVLADFVVGANRLFGKDGYVPTKWNYFTEWGMTESDFWGDIEREGADFWGKLPKTQECDRILALVESLFPRESICLLSACASAGRKEWIGKHLPDYRDRYLLGPAKQFVARPNVVLVDDADHNVNAFSQHGGHAILVPRPWNRNFYLDLISHLDMELTWFKEQFASVSLSS